MKDYSNIGAVCFDCAMKADFTPKNKAAGVWVGECEICHQQKPCTDLWHDWVPPKIESEANVSPAGAVKEALTHLNMIWYNIPRKEN